MKTDPICYVFGAGEMPLQTPVTENSFIIAADGGLDYLEKISLKADITVGDFDSLGRLPQGENVICHPAEKDDTDMLLALKTGLEHGYRRFVIYGGTGGRPDHSFANYTALAWLSQMGATGWLAGKSFCACAVKDSTLRFPPGLKGTVSVFAFGGTARKVTLKGLKYPLDGTLDTFFPLGVSNEFTQSPASVSVSGGCLLVFIEADPKIMLKIIKEQV